MTSPLPCSPYLERPKRPLETVQRIIRQTARNGRRERVTRLKRAAESYDRRRHLHIQVDYPLDDDSYEAAISIRDSLADAIRFDPAWQHRIQRENLYIAILGEHARVRAWRNRMERAA